MTNDEFWEIIAASRMPGDDFDSQVAQLREILLDLPRSEVAAFEDLFNDYMARADRPRILELAHDLGGGAGDDGFMDFRSWLVSRGRRVYRSAFKDEVLVRDAAVEGEDVDFEELQYVAGRILNGE